MVSNLRMLTPPHLCQLSNRFTSQGFDTLYSIFCQSIRCFTYDRSQLLVKVKKAKAKDITAFNELLNKPLFELRELDSQTIIEIEKDLREEYADY